MSRNLALVGFAFAGVLVAGCRDNGNMVTPADFAQAGGDGGNPEDMAMSQGDMPPVGTRCAAGAYTDTTIAALRAMPSGTKGCFQVGVMAPVVLLTQNHTKSTHANLIIQDSAGGDYSGIEAICDTRTKAMTAGYGCTVFATASTVGLGDKVTVAGYYNHTASGFEPFNIIDTFTDTMTAGTKPAALTPTLADLSWKSTTITAKQANQFANVNVAGATLKAYDWAPATFASTITPCTAGPSIFGFGVIPSTSPQAGTPGPACVMGGTEMPPATPSNDEILVSTTFYNGFKYTSDCKCYMSGFSDVLLAAGDSFTQLSGIIQMQGTVPSIAPTKNADIGK